MYHIVVIWFITLDREKYTLSYDILHGIVSRKSEKNKNGPPRLLYVLKDRVGWWRQDSPWAH